MPAAARPDPLEALDLLVDAKNQRLILIRNRRIRNGAGGCVLEKKGRKGGGRPRGQVARLKFTYAWKQTEGEDLKLPAADLSQRHAPIHHSQDQSSTRFNSPSTMGLIRARMYYN